MQNTQLRLKELKNYSDSSVVCVLFKSYIPNKYLDFFIQSVYNE